MFSNWRVGILSKKYNYFLTEKLSILVKKFTKTIIHIFQSIILICLRSKIRIAQTKIYQNKV